MVGGLIVLFTLIQLALLYWLEQNIKTDVVNQVKHINETALELALDRVFITEQKPTILQKKQADSELSSQKELNKNKQSSVGDDNNQPVTEDIEVLTFQAEGKRPLHTIIEIKSSIDDISPATAQAENAKEATKAPASTQLNKIILKREFKHQIDTILNNPPDNMPKNANSTFIVKNGEIQQHWITGSPINSKSKSKTSLLIESIQYSLILGAIIAIFFAYWLSVQFNRPLKELADGFRQLSQGNYKHQVKVIGVEEIRTTIAQFNFMLKKLDDLTQAEQHHKEIAHLAELGEVSRGLAHSLRNPIHTIGLAIEELQNDEIAQSKKIKLLTTIQHKITNIDKSIKALLTLTTTGINRNESIPLLAIIQDVILEYKSGQNKVINFNIDVDKKIDIKGAESEIRSILHTLIINACEASENKGFIYISAEITTSFTCIKVTDKGNGIEQNIAQQLFQPHISTKPEGAGMGLYIAKRIVTLHYQGKLTLRNNDINQVSQGCTACVCFANKKLNPLLTNPTEKATDV